MIKVDKWLGLVTNASPYTLPPGAMASQINLQCIMPGQLSCRPGLTRVTFVSQDAASSPIRSVFRYQKGTSEHVVYQDSGGRIYSSVVTGTS